MNQLVQVFKTVFVVVRPIEISLFFGGLPVIELEIYGIQVILASAVTGCIAGMILFPVIVLTLIGFCMVLVMCITAACTTAGFYLLRSSMGKIDQGIYRQHQHTE